MKKFLTTTIVLFISTVAFAQFGIIGGLTSSSTSIKTAYSELTNKMLNQYHVGITYKFGIGKVFAIQPILQYDVKGTEMKTLDSLDDIDFRTGFIELPVSLQIGYDFGKIIRLYGIVEPFIGYAVSNDIKWGDIKNTSWDNIKNRFEYGTSLGAGVELFKHLEVHLKYFWNFGELYNSEIDFKEITQQITQGKCGGITLSAAVLF